MSLVNVGEIRRAHVFVRSVASFTLLVFSTVSLSPSAQAIAQEVENRAAAADMAAHMEEEEKKNIGKTLEKAKDHLRVLADKPDAQKKKPTADERKARKEALREWKKDLKKLDEETRAEFAEVAELVKTKKLPKVIQDRHAEAFSTYRQEMNALNTDIDDALRATNDAVVKAKAEAALNRLNKAKLRRAQQEFNPNDLPNSALKPNKERKPKESSEEFIAAGLMDNPTIRLAAIHPFDISGMPSAGDPAFRAATTEVVLTPDIVAKASELDGNPVNIYNWVRNNVQWQPTWGAIQDASHTLSSKRGNAFDIASLTIALLRASNVPARYVHGVIEVPEAQFRNWAGGFQHIDAAIDFASAGGIPLTMVTAAGRITRVRIEHVWVEAAIDYVPSRGAVNRSADTWVAMDPSFKQLEVLPGLDAVRISGINPEELATNFLASGTSNEAEGWATGFNPVILQTAQTQARTALENHIEQNMPNATVGDVLGGRRIVEQQLPVLPATLPNRIAFTGPRYAVLPAALQQRITFAFGKDIEGYPINPQTFPWARLNNKQVTLSFRPAGQADEDALRALLPAGGITDISQLPTSIPAYLIRVVPELKVNGTVVMSGSSMTLGTDLKFVFNPRFVSSGVKPFAYDVPAGSYLAVAVVAGSVAPSELEHTRTQLTATRAALESGDQTQIGSLSRERLLGDLFHTGVLGYYAQYTSLGYIAGLKQGGHHQLAAGVGSFGYEPNVEYYFGVPRRIRAGGAVMNIPIVNVVGKDAVGMNSKDFTVQLGVLSSTLEHAVPEQMFTSATSPGEAISAVKALSKASAAGQRIYEITQANQASVLPNIRHDAATMDEIRSALSAGRTVITHTNAVSVPGWSGAGYVLMDAETGAAAWKIGGGGNGGWLNLFAGIAFALLALTIFLWLGLPAILGLVWAGAGAAYNLNRFMEQNPQIEFNWLVFYTVRVAGFALALALFPAEITGLSVLFGVLAILSFCKAVVDELWRNASTRQNPSHGNLLARHGYDARIFITAKT